ncbi:hypothetical protein CC78DRAFT_266653 [Lojkania enalia]|uniref:Uncharacterized protein n=1 Tax=Lojkania enalia TaxID=147567 RepID=A0A9P4K7Z2_9PLEO|nr:hypothetical protein CC78DRAFT_266653 [Didymosphaeria enalia]
MNASDDQLEEIVSNSMLDEATGASCFKAFFINTLQTNSAWLPGNFSIRPGSLQSLRKAGLSGYILSAIWKQTGYWAKMGNHNHTAKNERGEMASFGFSYRYVCGWDTGISFTQFLRTHHSRTYFCINYPCLAFDRFKSYLQHNPKLAYREFFLDALAADDSLDVWQTNIGKRREMLLGHERKYEGEHFDFNTAPRELHRLSRDWHILGQDCRDLLAQLDFLLAMYTKYMAILPEAGWEVEKSSNTDESLAVYRSMCDNLERWTAVYKDRTNLRINLLFHLANQRESRTNTEIASSTAIVAEQTQRDSASMITIAAVTMFFLPGTFVSAILSTTFFDYSDNGLHVSNKWWILLAATLPLTILVFGIWLSWRYFRIKKRNQEVQTGAENHKQVRDWKKKPSAVSNFRGR